MPLNYPALASKLAQAEMIMVVAFRSSASLSFAREKLRVAKLASDDGDDAQFQDFLADQLTIAEELFDLSEELAVIAAYRVLELNAKRLTRWLDNSYSHFSWPTLSKLLRSKTSVDLMQLDHARDADELRLLSNAIKHDGTVTQELSAYPGWKEGARVHPLAEAFDRLAPTVPLFTAALAFAVLPRKLGGGRPNEDVFPIKGPT